MKKHLTLLTAAFFLLVAACGDASQEETTTTAATEETTAPTETTTSTETTAAPPTTEAETTTTPTGESEAGGDLDTLQAAMATSSEAAPSRIEGVISVDLPGGETADMPISVQTDPDTGDTAMSMDLAAMATATGGTEDMPAEMAEMMGSMEVREIGDTVYLSFPFFTAFLGAETEWVSMPAEEGTDMTDDMTSGATPTDPNNFLDSFSDVDGSVEELGAEDIRGISTTHYQMTVNEGWQEQLTDEELAELEEQGPLPDASFPIDLWIDAEGLVHRMSIEMTAEALGETEGEEFEAMTMTFDFFDFGQPVTIEPPPADQVTDVSELSGPLGTIQP